MTPAHQGCWESRDKNKTHKRQSEIIAFLARPEGSMAQGEPSTRVAEGTVSRQALRFLDQKQLFQDQAVLNSWRRPDLVGKRSE